MNGFILAGTRSGIGKTTVAMGLMASFENVAPFKVGPDYIDPSFHRYVTGNISYNLDLFLMGEEGVKYSFGKHKKKISIVEGVMGLYDGLGNSLENYSTAHLSKVLNLPVILVVDAIGKSTSIAAEVLGYKNLDSNIKIKGVIINRVANEKIYIHLKECIENFTGIECLGYLKKDENLGINSRHLGLLQADEVKDLDLKIQTLKAEINKTINLSRLLELCKLDQLDYNKNLFKEYINIYKGKKIGIARDSAFSFYYEDNIEILKSMGIEIEYFSPLKDKKVPNVDMLYFGGGYPEIYAEELSKNSSFLESLRKFGKNKRVLGECGGFMYLGNSIEVNEKEYKMAGIFKYKTKMLNRLCISRFGYVEIEYRGKKGRGHEFHYSDISFVGNEKKEYKISKNDGREWECGYSKNMVLAGYPHIHFFQSMDILKSVLD